MEETGIGKKWMAGVCDARIKELIEKYKAALKGMSGESRLTPSGAACLRSRLKKDICSLSLIKELLERPDAPEVYGEDARAGFERLACDK